MRTEGNTAAAISLYRLRLEAVKAYGETCRCCGETRAIVLTLDHIVPIGKDRPPTNAVLARLRREGWPPAGLQVLCYNCNYAKRDTSFCPCLIDTEGVQEALHKVVRRFSGTLKNFTKL